MRKGYLIAAMLPVMATLTSNGQVTTGTIKYEEVMKVEIKMEGEMKAMMRDMPKEFRTTKMLYFNDGASLYEQAKVQDSEDMTGFNGEHRGIRMNMSAGDNKVFNDLKKGEIIEQREFMTRLFLIEQAPPEREWKITGKQKMILDFPCMEATSVDTAGILTRVWFAPSIPVQTGPALYSNLPGIVLEVDVDNGSRFFTATSIDAEAPVKKMLKRPKEGKRVTQDEFDAIMKAKMEEMGAGSGGSGKGTYMIKIHN